MDSHKKAVIKQKCIASIHLLKVFYKMRFLLNVQNVQMLGHCSNFFYNLMIHVMRKFVTPIIFFHLLVSIVARAFRRKKFEIFKEFFLNAKIWLIRFIRSRSYRFESITFILSVNMIKTTKRALIVYWASSGFFSSIFHWKLWQQSSKMT